MDMEFLIDLRRVHQTTRIALWAMMAALVVYAVIAEIVRVTHQPFQGFSVDTVRDSRDLYYGLAIIVMLAVTSLRKSLLKRTEDDNLQSLVKKLRLSAIVTYGLCELPAILGLVLFLLGGYYKEFYILLGYSLLVMLVYYPKYADWEVWLMRNWSGS